MENVPATDEKKGLFARGCCRIKSLLENSKSKVVDIARKIKKTGQDDPRRVIHSLKVGLALSAVSIFYYYQPLYNSFGVSAMWAIMTVVVVFEFSVGATLGKGLNRGIATLLAGALGVGAHHLANLSGHIGEPIVLGFFVFLQAVISTFFRFFPTIKARYDYGLLIFILTFSLISVTGFHDDNILELAHKRLSTIIIGGLFSIVISIGVFPVWAGEDLHNLIALNIERLGDFLEGFEDEYFKLATEDDGDRKDEKSFLEGYRSVLNSQSNEESLANFARWEPGHGRFQFRHPWKLYLEVGSLTRQCAYRIEALNGCLNADVKASAEVRTNIQEACTKMSTESGKALKELAQAVRIMTQSSSADIHVENAQSAAENLNSLLKSGMWEDTDLLQVIPVATLASLLINVVDCTELIAESVYELASKAHFGSVDPTVSRVKLRKLSQCKSANIKADDDDDEDQKVDCPHVVVVVNESPPGASGNQSSSSTSKSTNTHMEV